MFIDLSPEYSGVSLQFESKIYHFLEFSVSNIDVIEGKFTSNKPYLLRALYEWIIDNDATPYLLVDATKSDVQIPMQHVKDGQIVLNAAPSAIQNWFADNTAISFNARFSGKAQNIYIPMNSLLAIYAQENGMGMAFPEESEESSEKQKESDLVAEDDQANVRSIGDGGKKKKSHLKIIK